MRIHGLVACVNYGAFLNISGFSWLAGLSSLTIVTTPDDKQTRLLAQGLHRNMYKAPISLYLTYAFTENGASFNKGKAMEEARCHMPWEDWILFFDADMCPGLGQWSDFKRMPDVLDRKFLYSAPRYQVPILPGSQECVRLEDPGVEMIPDDRIGYGYFQLFHSSHPAVQKRPLLDTWWKHAGNYDSNFLLSFGDAVQDISSILTLYHLGPKHENWYGVGKEEQFRQMQETRGGKGIHPSERIDG